MGLIEKDLSSGIHFNKKFRVIAYLGDKLTMHSLGAVWFYSDLMADPGFLPKVNSPRFVKQAIALAGLYEGWPLENSLLCPNTVLCKSLGTPDNDHNSL